MSKFTSFIAIENKIVNPNGHNVLANVKGDLPEGGVYESVFGKQFVKKKNVPYMHSKSIMAENKIDKMIMPKTATKMPFLLIIGLASIAFSFLILFWQRKHEAIKNI